MQNTSQNEYSDALNDSLINITRQILIAEH